MNIFFLFSQKIGFDFVFLGDSLHVSKPISCKKSEKHFKIMSAEIFTQRAKIKLFLDFYACI